MLVGIMEDSKVITGFSCNVSVKDFERSCVMRAKLVLWLSL